MTTFASSPNALTGSPAFRERSRSQACFSLRLRPTDAGWALVTPDGELVFQAPGRRGRTRCLRFARAHGVLSLFS